MYLNKKSVDSKKTEMDIHFEKVADDLLMISITNQMHYEGILSYWRLTKVTNNPPLEIGIECRYGRVISITLFADVSYVKRQKTIDTHKNMGNVLIDTAIFTKINDYVDVFQGYEIDIQENELICMFGKVNGVVQSYRNDRLEIYVDCLNQVIGFAVCDLSEEEISKINSL